MGSPATGYYTSREKSLLGDLDVTSTLVRPWLLARYGERMADSLLREVRRQYADLIPEIPHIKGPRAKVLNRFLLITAQELAAYKVMKRNGQPPGEAWELCHMALRARLAGFPRWKRWLIRRFMFSGVVMRIIAGRVRSQRNHVLGDFEIAYVTGGGDEFDYGADYLSCGNYKFVMEHGGEEFAPYVCMSDIALGEALGWGLTRTQTLADGCACCDFRFKKGASTRISSKTPGVQEVITKIGRREAEQIHAVDAHASRR